MGAPVGVRAKASALFVDAAVSRERENLVAAGVGQYRTIPTHESMNAADATEQIWPRSQHQVIRVPEHDLSSDLCEVHGSQPRDRGSSAYGHERGRFDAPVRRHGEPATCAGLGVRGAEGEGKEG